MKKLIPFSMAGAVLAAGVLAGEAPVRVADRVVVNDDGAFVERQFVDGQNLVRSRARLSDGYVDPQTVTDPRWFEDDNGLAWICRSIAVGDSGAGVIAGKGLNNESCTLYSTGDPQPVFNVDMLGSEDPIVAMADRAPVCATYECFDTDPGPDFDFEATVRVFLNTGGGSELFSHTFPTTLNYFGGGVAISDDGKVVLTWKANPNTETLMVEAFDTFGNSISSGEFNTEYNSNLYFHSRQTRLSDDGSRAYFNVGVYGVIYDVQTATVEYEHPINASFDSHAFSGDGKRFAFGYFGYFRVYEETSPGTWSQIASQTQAGSTYVARLDLNKDGSRLGYQIQRYSPNYDHIETGLFDVDANADIFNNAYDAPGTSAQLVCAGVEVDALGEVVAGASWGDSLNVTPEVFCFDGAGNTTMEIDADGSAFAVALDADGDVVGSGHKDVHANEFGSGGDVIVADATDQLLHVLGYPQAGGSVDIVLDNTGTNVYVAVTKKIKLTSLGNIEILLGTQVALLGPYTVPGGGLTVPVNIPSGNKIAGAQFHFQSGQANGSNLTNKVSIRVQP